MDGIDLTQNRNIQNIEKETISKSINGKNLWTFSGELFFMFLVCSL
jgi:hypothetical protein